MRVMSWNVNKSANSSGRIDEQLDFIRQCDVDVLLVQEVRYGSDKQWLETWRDGLKQQGLGEIEHSCDWAADLRKSTVPPHSDIGHDNGHLTAVNSDWSLNRQILTIRDRLQERLLGHLDTHFPEKILVTDLSTPTTAVELWNIRAVPGNGWGEEKIKIFETVYNRIIEAGERTRLLAGDFNSPKNELRDGQTIPFGHDVPSDYRHRKIQAELKILKGLGHVGMIDVFRTVHGYGDLDVEDTGWNGKRFDHIIASEDLHPTTCRYDHAGFSCSDHAPIIAEFDP